MSCLVDTQALLWALTDDERLGPVARSTLGIAPVHVSAISLLEIEVLRAIGRVVVPSDLETRLRAEGWRPLVFSAEHADAVPTFSSLARHDPFDRALLAQARVERLSFLTTDRRLLGLGLDWVADATA